VPDEKDTVISIKTMTRPQDQSSELRPFMQARFTAAKKALWHSELCALASGALALLCSLLPEWSWLPWAGGGTCLCILGIQKYFDHIFKQTYDDAERIRRMFLLADGLGKPIPASELSQLRLEFGHIEHNGHAYYTSNASPGFTRLLTLLWESAFWTQHLQNLLAKKFWRIGAPTTALLSIASFFILAITSSDIFPSALIAAFSLLAQKPAHRDETRI
jgi:hypothetical protein